MEIEVRDFIRTNKGIIGRIKRIELDKIDRSLKWYIFDKKRPNMNIVDEIYINKPYITKYSKNIVDLIEMGDYVNGERVIEVIKRHGEDTYILHVVSLNTYKFITKKEIKIILTHEQYEQNCYRLEE